MSGPIQNRSDLFDRALREYFRSNLLDPMSWVRKADELREAAELLRPVLEVRWKEAREDPSWAFSAAAKPLGLNGVWLMLMGFAIENLSKACLIRALSEAQREEVERSSELPKHLRSHDLISLVQAAGLAIDSHEEGELKRMSEAATFFGRYPMPLRAGGLMTPDNDEWRRYNFNQIVDADLEMTRSIFERLRKVSS
jgi:hypothetical protein